MPNMAGMDCCQKAVQAESRATEVSLARLCCALNCSQTGTSGSTATQLPRTSTIQAVALHPASGQSPMITPFVSSSNWTNSPPQLSNPAYIRHLALLI